MFAPRFVLGCAGFAHGRSLTQMSRFAEPFLLFLSASVQGNQCKGVEGVDFCDCSSACKNCVASDAEPKGRKKITPHPDF